MWNSTGTGVEQNGNSCRTVQEQLVDSSETRVEQYMFRCETVHGQVWNSKVTATDQCRQQLAISRGVEFFRNSREKYGPSFE
jgi:hypothetical protein